MISKLKKESIPIKGMHCKNCKNLIESVLSDMKGIQSVKADLTEDIVEVEYNPDTIVITKIKHKISELGYGVDGNKPKLKKNNSFLNGIMFGLIPHIGCIAFIVASILGVGVLATFFRPLLMNRNIFYILILVSIVFATVSGLVYLKQNGFLSKKGILKKWKYLSLMYGSTVGINVLLFFLVFPLLASASFDKNLIGNESEFISSTKFSVNIPCPGHAPLIINELKKINGVKDIKYTFPNNFETFYDNTLTNTEEILRLDVFLEYPIKLDESIFGTKKI